MCSCRPTFLCSFRWQRQMLKGRKHEGSDKGKGEFIKQMNAFRNTHRRQQLSETQLLTHKHNGKFATRKWRQALAENKTEKLLVNIITPYRNKSSLGRAARRVQSVMPDSPRKQQAIFTHLAPKVLGFSVQPQEKTKPTEKEVETLVKTYITSMMSFHGSCLEKPIQWLSG